MLKSALLVGLYVNDNSLDVDELPDGAAALNLCFTAGNGVPLGFYWAWFYNMAASRRWREVGA